MMCLMFWYFCDDAIISGFSHLIGGYANYIWLFGFICLFSFSLIFSNKNGLLIPICLYVSIIFLVLFTSVFHPEYADWFNHDYYNLNNMLVHPRGAIWTFIVIWLVDDPEDIYNTLKIVACVLFIYYMLQYIQAMHIGYWTIYDVDGTESKLTYNMEFGYAMMFPAVFFGAVAFLKQINIYYLFYTVAMITILLGGSRGSAVWGILLFPIMLPFKWRNFSKKERRIWTIACFFLIPVAYLIYNYLDVIQIGLSIILSEHGISSRTIEALFSGKLSDANGRNEIYKMALYLIKTGGPFGRGIYGDRVYIGQFYRWGYSHNVVLELLVTFGYVGGSVVLGVIICGIINLFRKITEITEQIVFITFFVSSLKLILSNSFWYVPSFWALLVLIIKWKTGTVKQKKMLGNG